MDSESTEHTISMQDPWHLAPSEHRSHFDVAERLGGPYLPILLVDLDSLYRDRLQHWPVYTIKSVINNNQYRLVEPPICISTSMRIRATYFAECCLDLHVLRIKNKQKAFQRLKRYTCRPTLKGEPTRSQRSIYVSVHVFH